MSTLDDFEPVINTIADPIFVKDTEHRWVLLNDAMCKFMGADRASLIGKSDYDFFPKAEADVFWAKDELVFQTGEENTNDEQFTDQHGAVHYITTKKTLYVSPSGKKFIVGCIRDLTELRRMQDKILRARDELEAAVLERTTELHDANAALRAQIVENERTAAQLRRAQKLEAIGRLAGGIAHDFNNLLNVIIGYSTILEHSTGSDAQSSATHITKAAEKAAQLTRQLLAFSRKQVLQPDVLDLTDILNGTGAMLQRLIGDDIHLEIDCTNEPTCVRADRGQLEQVILNLAVNARDAMPDGGHLRISTASKQIGAANARELHVEPGPYVRITFSDTGHGMNAETQAHIFEPFFTTKDPAKGTGLGLATVYGIVAQSGGAICVRSEVGKGTAFDIWLPRVAETSHGREGRSHKAGSELRGGETLLVVEDQADLRSLLVHVLRSSGYKVLEADNGESALSLVDTHAGVIDVLVTDIMMPGMRGWELARRLCAKREGLKVLYMSGHTDTDLINEGELTHKDALLEKPFRPDTLLSKLRELISTNERDTLTRKQHERACQTRSD